MATLTDTFNDFFGEIDEERATEELKNLQSRIVQAEAAIAANDMPRLVELGYAARNWGYDEGSYRFDIATETLATDRQQAAMTPAQYMRWWNEIGTAT